MVYGAAMIRTRLKVRRTRTRKERVKFARYVGVRLMPGGREIKLSTGKTRNETVNKLIAKATVGGGDPISVARPSGGYGFVRNVRSGGEGGQNIP